MRVCRSPKLIAAYRGLHRLYVPRHPPHTFVRLTLSLFQAKHAHFEQVKLKNDADTAVSGRALVLSPPH